MNLYYQQPIQPMYAMPQPQPNQTMNVVVNFYGEKKFVSLNQSFDAMVNTFPGLLPREYANNSFEFFYTYSNTKYVIKQQQDYLTFLNFVRLGHVRELNVEICEKDNTVNNQTQQLPQQFSAFNRSQQMPLQQQQAPLQQRPPQQYKTYVNTVTNTSSSSVYQNNNNNNQPKPNKPIVFDVGCKECSAYPLTGTIFRCLKCKFFICEKCETAFGETHQHALIKIRNHVTMKDSDFLAYTNSIMFSQIQEPQISQVNQSQKARPEENAIVSSVKQIPNALINIPEKIKGLIQGNGNDADSQQERAKKIANLNPVQQMRVLYPLLSAFTDAQIETALKQSNFNKEEAMLKLFK